MYFNLDNQQERARFAEYAESNNNKGRKAESFKRSEILKDRIDQFVVEELRKQYDEETINELPRSSGVNICKRAINKTSIVYLEEPQRKPVGLNEDQEKRVNSIYVDGSFDNTNSKVNKYFKLHNQILVQIKPIERKLGLKIFQPHHFDAIYLPENPEKAIGFVISAYDKSTAFQDSSNQPSSATGATSLLEQQTENYNEQREMQEREVMSKKRYSAYYWSNGTVKNYIFDGNGAILSEIVELPFMPFVEVSDEKEFEYWVRGGSPFSNFTVEFNCRLSEASQVVKMQGFSQAYLKGPKSVIAQNIKVGPNNILRLPVDKENNVETDFGFASTNADINGTIDFLKAYLFLFLSSQSLDQSSVTTSENSEKYSSGFERLIAMIDRMISNKEDFHIFSKYEVELYEKVKAWLAHTNSTDTLLPEYKGVLPVESKVFVEFNKPEAVKTEAEELDTIQKKIDLGIYSPIAAIMYIEGVDREEAEKRYQQYLKDNATLELEDDSANEDNIEEKQGSEPDDKSE